MVAGRGLIHMKIVRQLVTSARKSHEIIDRNWRAVQKLAAELVKTERLDRKQIEQITGARFLFDRIKL